MIKKLENMNQNISRLYILFAGIFIISTFFKPYPFSWLIKLIPISFLIYGLFRSKTLPHHTLFLFGLIFSAFGDFFLDYGRDNLFIFGLGAFLIAHLFYLFSLRPIETKRLLPVFCYVIYGCWMLWILKPELGQMLIPVSIYIFVLLLMGSFTLVSKKSNNWLVIGGLSFVISDSLIGINKFYYPIAFSHPMIMMTYYFAQFALVKGILAHNDDDPS